MISLLSVLQNGNGVETATVGREGVVGAMAGLGLHRSHVKAVAQLDSVVARIQAAQFRKVAASRPAILDLCIRYNEVLLSQARITAACNLTHAIEARLCRWLLQTYDRAESNILPLTQEFLSEMLGVRRTSITDVAMKMQNAGAISYSRGIIRIVALDRLREVSCECYEDHARTSGAVAAAAGHRERGLLLSRSAKKPVLHPGSSAEWFRHGNPNLCRLPDITGAN